VTAPGLNPPIWPGAIQRGARLRRLRGPVIDAPLHDACIDEVCLIRREAGSSEIVGRAQVVGLSDDGAVLALLGAAHGLSRAAVIEPTGSALSIQVSDALLGTVIDADGVLHGRLATVCTPGDDGTRADTVGCTAAGDTDVDRDTDALTKPRKLDGATRVLEAVHPVEKCPVIDPFVTGVRVIDGVLGAGIGQRVVVLAGAGVGKTSLLQMIGSAPGADVVVMCLVGERGREVSETIERIREGPRAAQTVLVRATSDAPAVERVAAAACAMTVAEHFRDCGLHVLLVLDSLTRYARALREIALSAGELPARHGYPASVFERLPRLLERAGRTRQGAITAFFSVLADDDDTLDPIAHEVMSIVDGHIVLSRQLAGDGFYPAIDVARSVSRVASRVGTREDLERANRVRRVFGRAAELAMLVDMGEYRAGAVPDDDYALEAAGRLRMALSQAPREASTMAETKRAIDAALA
jgi:type III secretion system ATPase